VSSIRRPLVAAVGALAAATLVWSTGAQAATASCQKDLALINGGASGPLRCVSSGTPTTLVGRSTPLALKTISMTLSRVQTASRYTIAVRGQPPFRVKAKGVFILLTVTLTNETNAPHVFNTQDQVVMEINDSPNVPEEFVNSDIWWTKLIPGPTIQPHQALTGVLMFDVSKSALRTFPAKTGLAVVNFGQNTSSGLVTQLGVIDMAGAG
jgi:hypothetical protein